MKVPAPIYALVLVIISMAIFAFLLAGMPADPDAGTVEDLKLFGTTALVLGVLGAAIAGTLIIKEAN